MSSRNMLKLSFQTLDFMPCAIQQARRYASGFYRNKAQNSAKSERKISAASPTPDESTYNMDETHSTFLTEDNRPLFDDDDGTTDYHLKPKKKIQDFAKKKGSRFGSREPADERTPNLLTWAEKQQIKALYHESAGEWSIERLAGSFPASVETVQKIVKSKWEPDDVKKHDAAVERHWKQLLAGKIQVEPSLKLHLKSFLLKQQKAKKENTKSQSKEATKSVIQNSENSPRDSTELEHQLGLLEIAENDIKTLSKHGTRAISKYETCKIALKNEKKPPYPERIKIPQDKWKEGATYKVGDAYYHSDGTFLYRVPGML